MTSPEDRTLASVSAAVLSSGAVIALAGLVGAGGRFAVSATIGTVVAFLNFLVLARVVRAFTDERASPALWSLVYLAKILGLFGGVFLLLRSGSLSLFGVLAGLASLVPGIVLGGVAASHREP